MTAGKTVVLAAGDFPRRGTEAWRILVSAKRVVACDSAANAYLRRFHRWPDVIIGDLDSISPQATQKLKQLKNSKTQTTLIRVADQDTNDLEKALLFCRERGWRNPVVVGATGRREDHAIGNVFRALDYDVEIVTDRGRFVPVSGAVTLKTEKGAAVSVFAPDPRTHMTSEGLAWPLDGVRFCNLFCATLNRATGPRVRLTATRPVLVYLAASASVSIQAAPSGV